MRSKHPLEESRVRPKTPPEKPPEESRSAPGGKLFRAIASAGRSGELHLHRHPKSDRARGRGTARRAEQHPRLSYKRRVPYRSTGPAGRSALYLSLVLTARQQGGRNNRNPVETQRPEREGCRAVRTRTRNENTRARVGGVQGRGERALEARRRGRARVLDPAASPTSRSVRPSRHGGKTGLQALEPVAEHGGENKKNACAVWM